MPQFILIIREDLSKYPRPDEELKEIVTAHVNWAKQLSARGIFKDGNGIKSHGRLVSLYNGQITEQPLSDVKEGVGGYYIIEVENFDVAVEIAKECPTFSQGDLVEVRELGA